MAWVAGRAWVFGTALAAGTARPAETGPSGATLTGPGRDRDLALEIRAVPAFNSTVGQGARSRVPGPSSPPISQEPMTPTRRLAIPRFVLVLGALLVVPVLTRADQAAGPAIASWQEIAQRIAGYGLVVPPAREIQPDVLWPDDRTRALEFRGAMPNPFHAETAIRFTLPTSARVSLRVYDVAGKLVRTLVDAQLPPGDHSALLAAGGLRSGVYFAVLRIGAVQMSRSVVLAR